jgi:hypothetical protein
VSQQILPLVISFGVALGLSLPGCSKDEPAPAAEPKAEQPEEKKPAVDAKIANAMAAAEKSARSEAAAPNGQTAPPPDGILGAEAAARELAPGQPAQLVLGGNGSEPRVQLGGERIVPGVGPGGKLSISYRSGGSVMPTIEFDVKSKIAAAGAQTQPVSITPNAATTGNVQTGNVQTGNTPTGGGPTGNGPSGAAGVSHLAVRFVLAGAQPASNQPGRLPDNARAEIAKLNGSYVELVTLPNGALVTQSQKLNGNNPDLEPLVTSSAEALSAAILPYPDVAVGVGAFWMVKARETMNGAPVIAYRMVKLVELGPALAKLSVNTRRYLVEPKLPMAGLPQHQVRRFESEGEATLQLKPGSPYPDSAELRDAFMALVTPSDRPNQTMPVRTELSANVSFER